MPMVKMNRAIKYRAYPTDEQAELFAKTFGCVRFIWNQMLADSTEFYAATDKPFVPTPAKYKKKFPFLDEVDSPALCNAQLHLEAHTGKRSKKKMLASHASRARRSARNLTRRMLRRQSQKTGANGLPFMSAKILCVSRNWGTSAFASTAGRRTAGN